MDLYPLILRILHIGAAMFWAGATWMLAGFLTPAVKSSGLAGPQVMGELIRKRRLSEGLGVAAVINVASGLLLYWRLSSGLRSGWLLSGPGLSLTVGAIAGSIAFFVGFFVTRPSTVQMGKIGGQIAAAEGPPQAALVEELGALQGRLEAAGIWISVLLAVAVIAMAGAEQMIF